MKTCWKSLPPFRVIGDALMRRYNRARAIEAIADKQLSRIRDIANDHGLSLVLKR